MKNAWLNHLNNLYSTNCFENILICGESDCEVWFSTNQANLLNIETKTEFDDIFYLNEKLLIKYCKLKSI